MSSKYDILNTAYGVLNPQYTSTTGKNHNSGEAGFLDLGFKTINDTLGKSTSNEAHGPMVGICLRNEGRVSKSGWIDPSCWAAVSSEIIESGSELDLVQIRVRVPELHGMKPVPEDLPDRLVKDANHDIINQYPVFVSQFSSVSEPAPGDLVWIDFQDKNSQQGGIYLGVADATSFSGKSESKDEEEGSKAFKKKRRKVKRTKGSKRDIPENAFDYSLKYNDGILIGMFPTGVVEGEDSEEEFKGNFDGGFFSTAGSDSGKTYYDLVKEALKKYNKNIPIALVAALMQLESNFKHNLKAKTSSAKGLGQMLDSTRLQEPKDKKYFHEDPFKVDEHIPMVVKLIAKLFELKSNHPPTAIHSYWGGPGDTPPSGTKIWNGSETPYKNPYYPEKIFRRFEHYHFGVPFVDTPFGYKEYFTYRLDGGRFWLTGKGIKVNK
tara:strand:- start:5989 stop:7296 length:1308 start_codon:yes stop_codon:yes gene_type:complete